MLLLGGTQASNQRAMHFYAKHHFRTIGSFEEPVGVLNYDMLLELYFAAYKKHISLYPAPTGVAEFQEAVAVYGAGKGTLRFPLDQPLPFDLIRNVVQFRARENAAKAATGKKK
jgi:hypothetical protein